MSSIGWHRKRRHKLVFFAFLILIVFIVPVVVEFLYPRVETLFHPHVVPKSHCCSVLSLGNINHNATCKVDGILSYQVKFHILGNSPNIYTS